MQGFAGGDLNAVYDVGTGDESWAYYYYDAETKRQSVLDNALRGRGERRGSPTRGHSAVLDLFRRETTKHETKTYNRCPPKTLLGHCSKRVGVSNLSFRFPDYKGACKLSPRSYQRCQLPVPNATSDLRLRPPPRRPPLPSRTIGALSVSKLGIGARAIEVSANKSPSAAYPPRKLDYPSAGRDIRPRRTRRTLAFNRRRRKEVASDEAEWEFGIVLNKYRLWFF
ncbi:hypothetical protein EVAR_96729_1 [Eumeta japonica]|uniref:Uncharacterized protein n=1 Tax=Eumeta variegata TaxID=151549 RepID=A0A4C1SR27_EUMVA|nr:hypothetical protein EVAR_96729_1 [Eumeta japonica]